MALDARGSLPALGLCRSRGVNASLGEPGMGSHCTDTHSQPPTGHMAPLCLSFSTNRSGGEAVRWSAAPWAGWVGKKVLGAAGKGLCPREGGGGGLSEGWRRFVHVCVQPGGLCLWDGQGEGSVFPGRGSEAAFELVCAFPMGKW